MRTFDPFMPSSKANDLRSVPVFLLSDEELQERLKPAADAVIKSKWSKNGYITYYDEAVCPSTDYMVHEFRDRKQLVKLDKNGKAHLIKLL